MEEQNEEQGLVRIGKRVYVGNLAWRTSWQDLKVNKNEWRDVEKNLTLHLTMQGPLQGLRQCGLCQRHDI